MPDPFISPTDLVNYLGRGTATDPGMVIAVDAACDTVRGEAEQDFNAATRTFVLDGTGTDVLLLPQSPVSAAGTVLVNGAAVSDYVVGQPNRLIRKITVGLTPDWWTMPYYPGRVWPVGRQNIQVTADVGYTEIDLPRDVRMVALSLASRLVVQGPALEETVGNVRVKYAAPAGELTTGERRILRKYKQSRS